MGTVEPAGDAVGWANIAEWAHNMTFHNIKIGPVGSIKKLPVWYDNLNFSDWKPCSVPGLGTTTQVLRALNDPEPLGVLVARDTFDLTGAGVTLGTPANVKFAGYKYLQMFDVELTNQMGFWRDCNYKRSSQRNVCGPSLTQTPTLVTRSSAEQLTGLPHGEYAMGICDANAVVGSWFTFPEEGMCGDKEALGTNGCTWKLKRTKAVLMECMLSFNSSGWERAWDQDIQKAPFPNVQAHIKAALSACPEVRDSMLHV